jgi:uncharacterized metal-binding protein/predicted Fe-Mo cluster-binding NifX family protein
MRCGIPLLGDRVAPRCTGADSVILLSIVAGRVTSRARLRVEVSTSMDLLSLIREHRIDTLVCGGISRDAREALSLEAVRVVDNVAGPLREVLPVLQEGALRPGYGLRPDNAGSQELHARRGSPTRAEPGKGGRRKTIEETGDPQRETFSVNCLKCTDPICLSGGNCLPGTIPPFEAAAGETKRILEAAADVSLERERQLCRLAELVYFCIEMRYRNIGLAYCVDLQEPAQILSAVLKRFFEVVPVCCKVGGVQQNASTGVEPAGLIACNPAGQAMLLNRAGTELNVIVGLCVGADMVFAEASEAPITNLFVKDKSLANNPIGALYSEYYLEESLSPSQASVEPAFRSAGGEPKTFNFSDVTSHRRGPKEEP